MVLLIDTNVVPDECDYFIEDAAALIDGHICINFFIVIM